MASRIDTVLVTGATGFIGAHIVDCLLDRGLTVRGATRSLSKGQAMSDVRPQHASRLSFVQIADFENPGGLSDAVKGVDAIIHTASPLTYDTTDNEKELVVPAINGVRAVFEAAAASGTVQRIVITSSFASVLDAGRKGPPYFTYTGQDWNPLSYKETIDPKTSAVVAYRGAKKFAEKEAWTFLEENKPNFDVVALCPPMTFGPMVHPINHVDQLNESNSMLWKVAKGQSPLPVARVPFWVDVRDVAAAHVEALLRANVAKRYTPSAPERFTYGLAASIMTQEFPSLKDTVGQEEQHVDESYGLDGESAARDLGFTYHSFRDAVRDLIKQVMTMEGAQ
ncbi:3-beta hydroxysteroid dehydrogenase/isomerase family protein [Sarocladium implicatum]|nr:3-beta hydroxysteroid dehydrogenase/isomerase family protein [Sarocladium implicatum]